MEDVAWEEKVLVDWEDVVARAEGSVGPNEEPGTIVELEGAFCCLAGGAGATNVSSPSSLRAAAVEEEGVAASLERLNSSMEGRGRAVDDAPTRGVPEMDGVVDEARAKVDDEEDEGFLRFGTNLVVDLSA